ncbi:hypothetical protein TNCV_3153511 [Trichonephila clavipes]|nr:hypothetical protein TNCV_3153511 [Trichonephila clavipes]
MENLGHSSLPPTALGRRDDEEATSGGYRAPRGLRNTGLQYKRFILVFGQGRGGIEDESLITALVPQPKTKQKFESFPTTTTRAGSSSFAAPDKNGTCRLSLYVLENSK